MRKAIMLSILSFFIYSVNGQNFISFSSKKDSIPLGSPFTMKLKISINQEIEDGSLSFETLDSIPNRAYSIDTSFFSQYADYSILDGGNLNITPESEFRIGQLKWVQQGNSKVYEDSISVAIYDIGMFDFPIPQLTLNGSERAIPGSGRSVIIFLPEVIQSNLQDSLQVAPIKPIIEEPMNLEDFQFLLYGLGIMILCIILYYVYKKYRAQPATHIIETEEIQVLPAHVVALEKLNELSEKQLWQQGRIKEYQSELTFIIREYLENRYELNALEMTTDEILVEVPAEVDHNKLRQILQIADMVKFAKAEPPENIHQLFMDMSIELVKATQLIESENE